MPIFRSAADDWFPDMESMLEAVQDAYARPVTGLPIVALAWWASEGFPTFSLSDGLQDALSLTDLGVLPDLDFHLPFPRMVVQLARPVGPWREVMVGTNEVGPDIHDVWDVGGKATALFCMFASHYDKSTGDFRSAIMKADPPGKIADVPSWFDSGAGGSPSDPPLDDPKAVAVSAPELDSSKEAMRIVYNFLLWLIANKDTSNKNRHLPRYPHVVQRSPSCLSFVAGPTIRLPHHVREEAERSARSGYKILSKFMVRGHWRNQACGVKMQDHKLMWIEPYWKGPEAEEALERRYVADIGR